MMSNNVSDASSSDASGSPTSSHASPSIGSSNSSQTDATTSSTPDILDLNMKNLLLELFGFKASSSSSSSAEPCLDPAVWAAWQRTASLSTIATTQLLNTMRMGAPYTPGRFVETYALLAGVFRQEYDRCEEKARVEIGKGKGKRRETQ